VTYDHWKTTEPDSGEEPPEKPVYTESDVDKITADLRADNIELMRELKRALEDVCKEFSLTSKHNICARARRRIAELDAALASRTDLSPPPTTVKRAKWP